MAVLTQAKENGGLNNILAHYSKEKKNNLGYLALKYDFIPYS